jgi:SAM-dependent methyltransferase/uncharacterized protein YbaR (Trm112 family)
MGKLDRIAHVLACPDCHRLLSWRGVEFKCQTCARNFQVKDGVPVLFSRESEEVELAGTLAYGDHDGGSVKNRLKRFFPLPNFIVARPTLHDRLREQYILGASPEAMILNLGSGTANRLVHPGLINLDIYPHENTDVAGDAHQLPLLDGSLDGVWLCAVMEHLARPFEVAAEVFRVLKPGGFVLVTVPFIQPRHGSPHDYFRYTLDGMRSVFRDFREIAGGSSGTGPVGAWAEMTMSLAGVVCRRPAISYGLRFLVGWPLYPVAFLDRFTFLSG